LTSIPAIAGRMLATPCACGRISVTVDVVIMAEDKAMAVPTPQGQDNQPLAGPRARTRAGG
jgi:hypothetical protein